MNIEVKKVSTGVSYTIGEQPIAYVELYVPSSGEPTAVLHNIEGLVFLQDLHDDTKARAMLDCVNRMVRQNHPQITSVSLHDTSDMPCHREYTEDLDVLTYFLGCDGITWYERNLGAYLTPESLWDTYRAEVKAFCSKENKLETDFATLHRCVVESGNVFAIDTFHIHSAILRTIYANCGTIPEFFQILGTIVEKTEKARLFQRWLTTFVSSHIHIVRDWKYDLRLPSPLGRPLSRSLGRPV
jgi:hypothetical protein